ncbi:MAG: hypothetical protein NVS2B8_01390 [Vulcanimicrobiaceae bacterium]
MQRFFALAAAAAIATHLSTPALARSSMSTAMPTCAAGDTVVWVNTRSKVYYMPGASYYGKTKHGKYVCASAATSMGAHAAKSGTMSDSNGMSSDGEHVRHGDMRTTGGTHGSAGEGPGSMAGGATIAPGASNPRGAGTPAPGASPGIVVSPIPMLTASPSSH